MSERQDHDPAIHADLFDRLEAMAGDDESIAAEFERLSVADPDIWGIRGLAFAAHFRRRAQHARGQHLRPVNKPGPQS